MRKALSVVAIAGMVLLLAGLFLSPALLLSSCATTQLGTAKTLAKTSKDIGTELQEAGADARLDYEEAIAAGRPPAIPYLDDEGWAKFCDLSHAWEAAQTAYVRTVQLAETGSKDKVDIALAQAAFVNALFAGVAFLEEMGVIPEGKFVLVQGEVIEIE